MQKLVTYLIRGYRYLISPFLPPSCRFVPSCSEYTMEAVNQYGAVKGVAMGAQRIVRCHPFAAGGYDPVPARTDRTTKRLQSESCHATPCTTHNPDSNNSGTNN